MKRHPTMKARKLELEGNGASMVYDENLGFQFLHGNTKAAKKKEKNCSVQVYLAENPQDLSKTIYSDSNTWEEFLQAIRERLTLPADTRMKLSSRLGHKFLNMAAIKDGSTVCVTTGDPYNNSRKGKNLQEMREKDAMMNSNRPTSAGWRKRPEGVTPAQLQNAPVVDISGMDASQKWLAKYAMQKEEWQKGVMAPGEEMITGVERMDIFLPMVKQFKEDLVIGIQDAEDAEVSTREQRETIKVLRDALEQAFFANIFVIHNVVQFLGEEERTVYKSIGAKIRKNADMVIAWGTNQTEVREEFAKLDMKRKRWHRALAAGAEGLAWKALKEKEVSEIKGSVAKSEAAAEQMRGWEWLVRNDGSGPYFQSAEHSRVGAVQFCLDNGISTETMDSMGNKPLYMSALKNTVEIARMLLEAGTDVNHVNQVGRTALWIAGQHDNAEVVEVLLKAGAALDVRDNEGATALWIAAKQGSSRAIKLLIKAGASIDTEGHHGMSALMSAAYYGDVAVVAELIKAGASLILTGGADPERMLTAYEWASIKGHAGCMKLLQPKKWGKLHLLKGKGTLALASGKAAEGDIAPSVKAEAKAVLAEIMEGQEGGDDGEVTGLIGVKPEVEVEVNFDSSSEDEFAP
jgi:hypothetical protein